MAHIYDYLIALSVGTTCEENEEENNVNVSL